MSQPCRIDPETTLMLTRRCTQRQFLMRPDDEMSNAFLYCAIEAAQKFGIDLMLPQMMSNHRHTVFDDPQGNAVEF
jgi:putative transposase